MKIQHQTYGQVEALVERIPMKTQVDVDGYGRAAWTMQKRDRHAPIVESTANRKPAEAEAMCRLYDEVLVEYTDLLVDAVFPEHRAMTPEGVSGRFAAKLDPRAAMLRDDMLEEGRRVVTRITRIKGRPARMRDIVLYCAGMAALHIRKSGAARDDHDLYEALGHIVTNAKGLETDEVAGTAEEQEAS